MRLLLGQVLLLFLLFLPEMGLIVIHENGMCSLKPSFMDQIKQGHRKEKADVENSCFRTCCFVPFVEKLKTYSGIHVPASLC